MVTLNKNGNENMLGNLKERFLSYFNKNLGSSQRYTGQNCYGHFCKTGNDFDRFLNSFGAKRMLKIEKADNNFNETFSIWIDKVKNRLKKIEEKDGRKDNFRRMEAES